MRRQVYPLFAYLKYWFEKEDQYAIQSPFVFDLYNGLLGFVQQSKNNYLDIEALRNQLLSEQISIEIDDFGAGSKRLRKSKRMISSIAKYSVSSRKHAQLYQYLCSRTPAESVFELGTCLGINTLYLSKVTKGQLYTFEGSVALWEKSQSNLRPQNTHYILGDLKNSLPYILEKTNVIDFILIDANHTYEATIQYFEQILSKITETSIVAVADIHWSQGMNMAWEQIRKHREVVISLDFFECGILIFNKKLTKSHYVLAF